MILWPWDGSFYGDLLNNLDVNQVHGLLVLGVLVITAGRTNHSKCSGVKQPCYEAYTLCGLEVPKGTHSGDDLNLLHDVWGLSRGDWRLG